MPLLWNAENSFIDVAASASPIGPVAVAVVSDCVAAVSIGHRDFRLAERSVEKSLAEIAGRRRASSAETNCRPSRDRLTALKVIDSILQYADGEPNNLSDLPIVLNHLTPFQRRVVNACRAIPYGSTRTYGELARRAGRPAAARAVGQVMAANRMPLLVPCHRVVASSGRIGGFSAPQGLFLKRRLLDLEQSPAPAIRH